MAKKQDKGYRKMKVMLMAAKMDFARFIPLGIAYLAAYCEREGHTVQIFDELPGNFPNLKERLMAFKPDIIGVSCMTATYSKACEYAMEIRSITPLTPIVFGGVHPTVATEDTMQNDFVDFVIYGEGEETFAEFLNQYRPGNDVDYSLIKGLAYKKDGNIFKNPERKLIKDLNDLPMPARHLFSMEYYAQRWNWPRGYWNKTANMMSSRGCPYNCTFCGSKSMFGKTFRAFSTEKTVDEIEILVKEYGFECISFSDDTFAINKKRAIEICHEIKRRDIKAVYRFQLRANTCDEDLIAELKKAGCIHIDIGAESGSDKILKQMRKGITVQQIRDSVKRIKKYGIHTGVTFIIGSPGETEEDIEKTRNLAEEIDADYTQFFIMTPYPGTELYDYAKENNLLPDSLTYDFFRHGGANLKPFLNTIVPPDRLIKLREELNGRFVDKVAKNYLKQPKFIKDVLLIVLSEPSLLIKFFKEYLRTFSFGKSLKQILPHKL
ncbi:MAG: radical SAM protein [Pseudomonadota bacterium]